MKVWMNGVFVEDKDAKVGVFDAGFQHGVGLFETLLARNGQVFRARQHMQRLAESAAMLRLTEQLQVDPLVEALQLTLKENEQKDARMRITVTGGDLNMLQRTGNSQGGDPTIVIQTQPPTEYPEGFYENGVMVSLASGRVNPYELGAGHKTLNYWSKLLNLQLSAMQQCGEALWLTPSAHVAGGSVSNIFVVKDGSLLTPIARGEEDENDEPSATLPGITRQSIIEIADGLGIGTRKSEISVDAVLSAEEVFLTNSSWGVLPVIGIRAQIQSEDGSSSQDQAIGDGIVGNLTKQLHIDYQKLVDQETSDSVLSG
ncbi:MAG: aminotransferase class IV [Phycisphaerales bacterium]|jgi:branched-subunit amino acid aminotransferase/4-amino-4-deoxychorismate lyase|nr:aminotransferase class IV [Phycisphaerales bacterium]